MDDGRKEEKERRSRQGGVGRKKGREEKNGRRERRKEKGRNIEFYLVREWCVFSRCHLIHNSGGKRSSSVWLLAAGFPQNPDLNGMCRVVL